MTGTNPALPEPVEEHTVPVKPPSFPPEDRPEFDEHVGPPILVGPVVEHLLQPTSSAAAVASTARPAVGTAPSPDPEPTPSRQPDPPATWTPKPDVPDVSDAEESGPDPSESEVPEPAEAAAPSDTSEVSEHTPQHAHGLHAQPTPQKRRSARPALVLLSVALVAALGGAAYLAVLSNQWNERSNEWEAQSRELGAKVADLTADLAGMTSDLASTRDQLATAQQRITELADEKAQVGDDRETQKIIASDIQAVAEAAVEVSSLLNDCLGAQSLVNGYLAAPDSTTPEDTQTATDQMTTICTRAVDAYTSLQKNLAAS